jgi:hypothetical protein
MADLGNLSNILYIAFRLAPFLIVSFFTMSSIFNYDYKGLIYLVGLLLTTALTISISKTNIFAKTDNTPINEGKLLLCNALSLSANGPLSVIPLSILVSVYTISYLMYHIYLKGAWVHNISTYIIFGLLISGQIYWTNSNECSNMGEIMAAVIIGCGGGILWGLAINNMGMSHLGFFNGLGNQDVCSIPKKQTFKCTKRSKN